jgi:hypothetical protein
VLQPPRAAAVDGAEQLARTPLVPVDVVSVFMSAGTQLLSAASLMLISLVAGVEVWVQVQHQLCIRADIQHSGVAETIW